MNGATSTSGTVDWNQGILERFALVCAAVICWHNATFLWEIGQISTQPISLSLMLASLLAALALLTAVTWRPLPAWGHWLIAGSMAIVFASLAQWHNLVQTQMGFLLSTDGHLYMDYAATLIRNGENPYTHDLRDAFRVNRTPMVFNTPLINGDFTGRMPYPALSALLYLPFQWVGISTQWVVPLFLLGCLAAIWRIADPRYRWFVLLPFFVDTHYLMYSFGGVGDTPWAFFLILMIASWKRPRWRAVFYGLACAVKHHPWVIAPFLLIKLWNEEEGDPRARLRLLVEFAVLSASTFLLINLPFAVTAPRAWLVGSLEPVLAEMITFGQGLSTLTMCGIVLMPKGVFSILMLAALALCLYAYSRHYWRFPEIIWIFPAFVLWFGNRSLTSYWYYSAIPLVAALALDARYRRAPPARRPDEPSLRATLGAATAFVCLVLGFTGYYAIKPHGLEVVLSGPGWTSGQNIFQTVVDVTNRSDERIRPRFQIQTQGQQPHFWKIEEGSRILEPGQTDTYTIHTSDPLKTVDARHGARIIVSDARGASPRGSTLIEPHSDWVYADAVPNGDFYLWDQGSGVPSFWGLSSDPPGAGSIGWILDPTGPARLSLYLRSLDEERRYRVELDTYMLLPEYPVEAEVFVPKGANVLPDLEVAYGFRLIVNHQEVWVLFGDEAVSGTLENGVHYWMIPTPRERWTVQAFHPREIFLALGMDVRPAPVRMPRFENREFPMTPMNFQMMVSIRGVKASVWAPFGRVTNQRLMPEAEPLIDRAIEEPEFAEIWIGKHNLDAWNPDIAEPHLEEAIRLAPDNGLAWMLLGDARRDLGKQTEAIEAWRTALALGWEPGGAHERIASVELARGRKGSALYEYEKAVRLWQEQGGSSVGAHRGAIRSLLALGRCEEAERRFATLHVFDPVWEPDEKAFGSCPSFRAAR